MNETPREAILTEAAGLITGDRNKTYGSPTENFSNTAALWNVQIGHKLKTPLTAADVAQLMVQLKMARMIAQPKRDNYVDAAGYLACGWECEEAIEEPEPETPEAHAYSKGFTDGLDSQEARYWHAEEMGDRRWYKELGGSLWVSNLHSSGKRTSGDRSCYPSIEEALDDHKKVGVEIWEVLPSSVPEWAR